MTETNKLKGFLPCKIGAVYHKYGKKPAYISRIIALVMLDRFYKVDEEYAIRRVFNRIRKTRQALSLTALQAIELLENSDLTYSKKCQNKDADGKDRYLFETDSIPAIYNGTLAGDDLHVSMQAWLGNMPSERYITLKEGFKRLSVCYEREKIGLTRPLDDKKAIQKKLRTYFVRWFGSENVPRFDEKYCNAFLTCVRKYESGYYTM